MNSLFNIEELALFELNSVHRLFPYMNIFMAFFGQKAIILFIALLDAPLNSKTNPFQLNFTIDSYFSISGHDVAFFCHTYCIKQFNLIHIPLSLIFLALSVSDSHFPLLFPLEPVARLGICLLCLAYTQTALAPFHSLSLFLFLCVCVCHANEGRHKTYRLPLFSVRFPFFMA